MNLKVKKTPDKTHAVRIVLLHGLFGFARIGIGKLAWEYFRFVQPLLEAQGFEVITPSLPWAGGIKQRAIILAKLLEGEDAPLHLIGHSMGGLDGRYYITHLDGWRKVRSLTTLATPHYGSAAADMVCQTSLSPWRLFAGIHDLRPNAMTLFNANTPDHKQVQYRSYAACRPLAEIPWLSCKQANYIQQHEGDNDSLVALQSAAWGECMAKLHADHFELIGLNIWANPLKQRTSFNIKPLYNKIGQHIYTII
ncbi:MAG: alpha/beta fold hydrolase [Mariprofundales bacterium]